MAARFYSVKNIRRLKDGPPCEDGDLRPVLNQVPPSISRKEEMRDQRKHGQHQSQQRCTSHLWLEHNRFHFTQPEPNLRDNDTATVKTPQKQWTQNTQQNSYAWFTFKQSPSSFFLSSFSSFHFAFTRQMKRAAARQSAVLQIEDVGAEGYARGNQWGSGSEFARAEVNLRASAFDKEPKTTEFTIWSSKLLTSPHMNPVFNCSTPLTLFSSAWSLIRLTLFKNVPMWSDIKCFHITKDWIHLKIRIVWILEPTVEYTLRG